MGDEKDVAGERARTLADELKELDAAIDEVAWWGSAQSGVRSEHADVRVKVGMLRVGARLMREAEPMLSELVVLAKEARMAAQANAEAQRAYAEAQSRALDRERIWTRTLAVIAIGVSIAAVVVQSRQQPSPAQVASVPR